LLALLLLVPFLPGCGGGGGGGATGALPGSGAGPVSSTGTLEGYVYVPAPAGDLVSPPAATTSPASPAIVPSDNLAPPESIIPSTRIYVAPVSPPPAAAQVVTTSTGISKAAPDGYVALEGAAVHNQNTATFATTDAQGYFRLNEIPSGTQTIHICKTGYEAITRDCNIIGGTTTAIDSTTGYVTTTTGTTPYISFITPANARVGEEVQIKGVNFAAAQGAGSVTFNGIAAAITLWQDQEIHALIPAGAASGPVMVNTGAQASNSRNFTITDSSQARWTVLVYLDGDNNLEGAAIDDINEMEQVGSTDMVNIILQVDRASGYDTSNGDWTTCRRYRVAQDANNSQIGSTMISDLGEVNMADPTVLSTFLTWGVQNYPADHYLVVLWDHGSGWRFRSDARILKSIISDNSSGQAMDMDGLKSALSASRNALGRNLDLVGTDACLMNMAEVACQLRGIADYMVGSEQTEPGDGWPYDQVMAHLVAAPTMNASTLAGYVVSDYGASYGGIAVTQSALNLNAMGGFITDLNTFAQACIDRMETYRSDLQSLRTGTQSYYYSDYLDLYHYLERVRQNIGDSTIANAASNLQARIGQVVIAEYHTAGGSVGNSHGLAIWLPTQPQHTSYNSSYASLDLSAVGLWDEFLTQLWASAVAPIYRIELSWGSQPTDLDSHLWDANGNHCYYANMQITGAYLGNDSSAPGPETTYITRLYSGGSSYYDFAVNAYSGNFPVNQTATVKVYQGNNPSPGWTFTRTSFENGNRWWNVFRVNAANGTLTAVDTYASSAPRTLPSRLPAKLGR